MKKKELQVVKKRKIANKHVQQKGSVTLIDRFLSDPFGSWQGLSIPDQRSLGEVEETKDAYILLAELPGTSIEEVKIKVHGRHISISAEHQEHYGKDDGDHNFRHSCRSFQQKFILPETVDADMIHATCTRGLLKLFMPKKKRTHTVVTLLPKPASQTHHHHKGHL